ncbi:Peptidase M16 inactive domain protein [uncultured archaeon]|nr:Peptidase M16 inactive domain protein [uncultured archaeon]
MDRIQSINLENGLKVYLELIPIRESSAYLVVNAGSINDRVPETAHVVEHMQCSGSRLYGERGTLNYATTESRTEDIRSIFYFSCMFSEDLSRALKNLSLVLAQPHIRWLDRERSSVRGQLKDLENPYAAIGDQIFSVLFPETSKLLPSLKKRLYGVGRVNVDVCREFFNQYYAPGNSFLYIGGKLSSDFDKAMAKFRNTPVRKPVKNADIPKEKTLESRVEIREKWAGHNGNITIAYQVPLYPDVSLTEHTARIILANLLSEDYGPLYRRLRDKKKVCDGASVEFNKVGKAGQLNFDFAAHPKNFSLIENEFRQALTHIAIKGIRNDHLESFRKAQSISRLHMMNHPDINRIFTKLDYGVDADDVDTAISRVSQQDVSNVARMLLNRGYVVAMAVPS